MATGLSGRCVAGGAPALFIPDREPGSALGGRAPAFFERSAHRDSRPDGGTLRCLRQIASHWTLGGIQLRRLLGTRTPLRRLRRHLDHGTCLTGPVYLWLNGGRLEVRDAAQIWGQDTYQTQESIKKELDVAGTRVACVGPAAENGVLFAGIFCDHGRTAGRTGLGAVMASKNLKAIAVKGKRENSAGRTRRRYNTLRSAANRALKKR